MTSTEVRDKKIALAERRYAEALAATAKHEAHIERLDRDLHRLSRELEWLRAMPVTDAPTPAAATPLTGD